jgi:hypothetical protein
LPLARHRFSTNQSRWRHREAQGKQPRTIPDQRTIVIGEELGRWAARKPAAFRGKLTKREPTPADDRGKFFTFLGNLSIFERGLFFLPDSKTG